MKLTIDNVRDKMCEKKLELEGHWRILEAQIRTIEGFLNYISQAQFDELEDLNNENND